MNTFVNEMEFHDICMSHNCKLDLKSLLSISVVHKICAFHSRCCICQFINPKFWKLTLFFSWPAVLSRCHGNTQLRLSQGHHVEDEVINSSILTGGRHVSDSSRYWTTCLICDVKREPVNNSEEITFCLLVLRGAKMIRKRNEHLSSATLDCRDTPLWTPWAGCVTYGLTNQKTGAHLPSLFVLLITLSVCFCRAPLPFSSCSSVAGFTLGSPLMRIRTLDRPGSETSDS